MHEAILKYDRLSVEDIEQIFRMLPALRLHGFPIVKKQDGRSQRTLLAHACITMLNLTGCYNTLAGSNDEFRQLLRDIRETIHQDGRLAVDAAEFLSLVRSPEHYTAAGLEKRKMENTGAMPIVAID
jgi:hypothetical protein